MFFQDQLSLNAGQKYCRMLPGEHSEILSTCIELSNGFKTFVLSFFEFRPALSYHMVLRPLFCLFLSGRLRQVSLYLLTLLTNLNIEVNSVDLDQTAQQSDQGSTLSDQGASITFRQTTKADVCCGLTQSEIKYTVI